MMTARTRRHTRLLATVHLGQAALLLLPAGNQFLAITADDLPPSWIVRILGLRILAQALPEAISPTATLLRLGVAIDSLHAVSMLGAPALWPQYRRAAWTSAAAAALSAATATAILRERQP